MAIVIGFAVVSSLLLFWILALTRHARRTLPPGAPFPVHGGPGGWDRWWPKERALLVWPVISTLIWLLNLGIVIYAAAGTARTSGGVTALSAVLVLPMVILAVSGHFALRAAARAASDHNTFA